MKYYIILLLAIAPFSRTSAQNWNEWFRQKETAIKYLVQQVAALKVYGASVWKGYEIASDGLQTIHAMKKENYFQHADYFSSLEKVNPVLREHSLVHTLLELTQRTKYEITALQSGINGELNLTTGEKQLLSKVIVTLQSNLRDNDEHFLLIMRDEQLQMKDDERLKRIRLLYEDQKNILMTVRNIKSSVGILMALRKKEERELKSLRRQYGLY